MPITVLVADPDPSSRQLLQRQLARCGFASRPARDGDEAWELLGADDAPAVAILDARLRQPGAAEICHRLRQRGGVRPYLILLGADELDLEPAPALLGTADDYLSRPLCPRELNARLTVARRVLHLQGELDSARDGLRQAITHDWLTGTLNRRRGQERLRELLARASTNGDPLAVVIGDIDRFRSINEGYGPAVGDEVLTEIATRLRRTVQDDLVVRWGSEEFLLLLPGIDSEGARQLAERMRRTLAAQSISTEGGPLLVTLSWGVAATACPEPGIADDLLRLAETALRSARSRGSNRVEAIATDRPLLATA